MNLRLKRTPWLIAWICAITPLSAQTDQTQSSKAPLKFDANTRNSDRDFLQSLARTNAQTERARLRQFILDFVSTAKEDDVDKKLRFYANRVDYYNHGVVGKDFIRQTLLDFNTIWPDRRFWVGAMVQIIDGDKIVDLPVIEVRYPLGYVLRNGPDNQIGKTSMTVVLKKTPASWEIISIREMRNRR